MTTVFQTGDQSRDPTFSLMASAAACATCYVAPAAAAPAAAAAAPVAAAAAPAAAAAAPVAAWPAWPACRCQLFGVVWINPPYCEAAIQGKHSNLRLRVFAGAIFLSLP